MIEVEIKLKIEDANLIAQKLEEQGYKKSTLVKETDIYFNGVDRDFRKSDEALRIRKVESLDGHYLIADYDELCNKRPNEVITLTYKGHKLDNVSMAREETEIQVSDYEAMKKVLILLGYKPVAPVVKSRQYYFEERIVACIDNVEGLGDYLELEICVDDESQRKEALESIESMLNKLGYSMDDTTTTSYLSMLEKIRGEI